MYPAEAHPINARHAPRTPLGRDSRSLKPRVKGLIRLAAFACCGLVAAFACCGLLTAMSAASHMYQRAMTTQYGPLKGQVADVCKPLIPFGVHPGILLIHGGGWVGGDKAAYSERCRNFAKAGYVAVNINYRLADGTLNHAWPAALDDAHLALAWMRKNAVSLSLEQQRIAVLGDSSGGQLAVFLALNGHNLGIKCAVEESGPIDLLTTPSFVKAISPYVFMPQPTQATYRSASPVFAIDADTAPIMIVHGRGDPLVPFSQAEELLAALLNRNVVATFAPYNGGHVMQDTSKAGKRRIIALETSYLASCLRH
jgi:acetyl esterase/lipase